MILSIITSTNDTHTRRYYYAEKGSNGRGGGFLNGALEGGFLNVQQSDVQFVLMWANQDWVDVHPAKRGWSNTYRAKPPVPNDVDPNEPPRCAYANEMPSANNLLLQFDGYMNTSVYVLQLIGCVRVA